MYINKFKLIIVILSTIILKENIAFSETTLDSLVNAKKYSEVIRLTNENIKNEEKNLKRPDILFYNYYYKSVSLVRLLENNNITINDLQKIESILKKSIDLSEKKINNKNFSDYVYRFRPSLYLNLALIYTKMNKHHLASLNYQKVLDICEKDCFSIYKEGRVNILELLANSYQEDKNYSDAFIKYKELANYYENKDFKLYDKFNKLALKNSLAIANILENFRNSYIKGNYTKLLDITDKNIINEEKREFKRKDILLINYYFNSMSLMSSLSSEKNLDNLKLKKVQFSIDRTISFIENEKGNISFTTLSNDYKPRIYLLSGIFYQKLNKNDLAIKNIEKGLKNCEKNCPDELKNNIDTYLSTLTSSYLTIGDYSKSSVNFEKLANKYKYINKELYILYLKLSLDSYTKLNDFNNIERLYKELLDVNDNLENTFYLSNFYLSQGLYEKSLKILESKHNIENENINAIIQFNTLLAIDYITLNFYKKAREISIRNIELINKNLENNKLNEIDKNANLSNLGNMYSSLALIDNMSGSYDSAKEYIGKSISLFNETKNEFFLTLTYSSLGSIYFKQKNYDLAKEYYNKAINFNFSSYYYFYAFDFKSNKYQKLKITNTKESISNSKNNVLFNLASLYLELNNLSDAIIYIEKIDTILKNFNNPYLNGNKYLLYAQFYRKKKIYIEAKKNLIESEKILKEKNLHDPLSYTYYEFGQLYYDQKKYKEASIYLKKSVELKEKIRRDINEIAKKDFINAEIDPYQLLIDSYYKQNDKEEFLNSYEITKAKSLKESISKNYTETKLSINEIQKNLIDRDEIIIGFSNFKNDNPLIFAMTKEDLIIKELDKKSFNNLILKKYSSLFTDKGKTEKDKFENTINKYRDLIIDYNIETEEQQKNIAQDLYNFLIKPIESSLKSKKTIRFIPDSIIYYLPLETLINNNKFLIEDYEVKYIPSINIYRMLKNKVSKPKDTELIAFGGANYSGLQEKDVLVKRNVELNSLQASGMRTRINYLRDSNLPINEVFKDLDLQFSNLPSSLEEVQNLKKLFNQSQVLIGSEVNESNIKKLSREGTLLRNKILHFATHGIVYNDIPELSSIVLSNNQDKPSFIENLFNTKTDEDNFLTVSEISELKNDSDLTVLSACNTSMGKIFEGEGVLSLSSSFLISGSKGVSSSLWQVNDKSSQLFWNQVYQVSKNEKISFSEAMTKVKRNWINLKFNTENIDLKTYGRYKFPYFWNSFIYYGL